MSNKRLGISFFLCFRYPSTGRIWKKYGIQSLAELVPWNRSLGSLKVKKFGLCCTPCTSHFQGSPQNISHTQSQILIICGSFCDDYSSLTSLKYIDICTISLGCLLTGFTKPLWIGVTKPRFFKKSRNLSGLKKWFANVITTLLYFHFTVVFFISRVMFRKLRTEKRSQENDCKGFL